LLEEVFVPLYMMHRYQVEAASKAIGGLDYTYKVKGDNQSAHKFVPAKDQSDALKTLLTTISPEQLEVPAHVLALIPPRPYGYGRNRETFPSRTGPTFDPIAPAENIVDVTFGFLFEVGRVNRLYLQNLQDKTLPGFQSVLDEVTGKVFANTLPGGLKDEIKLMTEAKLTDQLIALAKNAGASQTVRAIARLQLQKISEKSSNNGILLAHRQYLHDKIGAFLELPEELTAQQTLSVPDGAPIGMEEMSCDYEF
jgi:hypothetical protein